MPLIAVANTKGGQGKTTWACAIAAHLGADLFDANPENGDAKAWAEMGGHPCTLVYPEALEILESAAQDKNWAVADCPPWDGIETRTSLAAASIVIVPVGAGYQDLRGLARMISLCKEAKRKANPRLQIAILGNGRRPCAFTHTWEEMLHQYHHPSRGISYIGSIPQRQAIVDAFGSGKPPFLAGDPAGSEMKEILAKIVYMLSSS